MVLSWLFKCSEQDDNRRAHSKSNGEYLAPVLETLIMVSVSKYVIKKPFLIVPEGSDQHVKRSDIEATTRA